MKITNACHLDRCIQAVAEHEALISRLSMRLERAPKHLVECGALLDIQQIVGNSAVAIVKIRGMIAEYKAA